MVESITQKSKGFTENESHMFLVKQVASMIVMGAHLPQRYLLQHKLQAVSLLHHKQQIVRFKMDLLDHTTQDLAMKSILQDDFKTTQND